MAHEILSVKMYELDKKLEQTHSRIQLAESMDTERLHQQIQNLRQECQESRITLENRLRHSKTDCVMKLAGVYDQVEAAVGKVLEAENINLKNKEPIFGNVLPGTEEKILTAEYALDFAMQAVNRALLVSLEAIEAQRLEKRQKRKHKDFYILYCWRSKVTCPFHARGQYYQTKQLVYSLHRKDYNHERSKNPKKAVDLLLRHCASGTDRL